MDQFEKLAQDQWTEARPEMVAKLRAQGTLPLYLKRASDRAAESLAELVGSGATYDQAWEKVSREELFLPTSEDAPDLVLPQL